MSSKIETIRKSLDAVVAAGAGGAALVNRSGLLVDSNIKEAANAETFAAMCATVFGAAEVACSEIKLPSPVDIEVSSTLFSLILISLSDSSRLVAFVKDKEKLPAVRKAMEESVAELASIL